MPYTLTKGLLWFVLALLLGIVIGWLLRSVRATFQIRAARRAALASSAGAGAPEAPDSAPPATSSGTATETTGSEPERAVTTIEQHDGESAEPAGTAEPAGQPAAPDPTDLTAIDGIDAAVADRCRAIGIQSWADLAATEVSLLRTMLSEAGPGYAERDPSTWPEQAATLLAAGTGPAAPAP